MNYFSLLDFVTHLSLLHHYFVWCITALLSLTKEKKSKLRKTANMSHPWGRAEGKPFRNKLVKFNFSRSFKIKSIIFLCSEVMNVYLLSAHEKEAFGFSMKGQRFKNVLINVLRLFDASPEKNQLYNWCSPYSDWWDKLFCWPKRSLGQKGLPLTYFLMIFHFQLCQPLDKLSCLCTVMK